MNKQEVLLACQIEGTVIKLPSIQLERKLYQEVAKALELIGGKWKGGRVAGFEFSEDPTELLAQIANGDSRNLKKEYQFFETPADVADWLVSLADVKPEHSILEPSAGQGAIIKAIQRRIINKQVFWCELMPINQNILTKLPNVVYSTEDYLKKPLMNDFDRIIANPPFSKNQDIDHVLKMYVDLKPGGRLVSIMSKHWQISSNRKETEFRKWTAAVKAKVHKIPAGSFKQSGTMIETIAVVINKPLIVNPQSLIVNPTPVPKAIVNSKSLNSKSVQPSPRRHVTPSMPLVCQAALKLEVYPPNARALVMQYFIGGAKINPDALQSLFGNKAGKSVESERKARFTWCSKTDGNSIDQIAHFLWEQNLDLDREQNIETSDFRDALEDVILSYSSTVQMAKDLMAQYNPEQEIPDEQEQEQEPVIIETPVQSSIVNPPEPQKLIPFSERKAIQIWHELETEWGSDIEKMAANYGASPDWLRKKLNMPIITPEPAPVPKAKPTTTTTTTTKTKPVAKPNLEPETCNLKLIKYSDRSIALIGDTRPLKDQLAALWGKYCPNLHINGQTVKGWIFSAKRESQLKQLIAS